APDQARGTRGAGPRAARRPGTGELRPRRGGREAGQRIGPSTAGTAADPASTGVVAAAGSRTVTSRPPPSRATAVTVPPCASHTARTIDSPSPEPRAPVRSRPPRRNGSNSPGTSVGSTSKPVLPTTSRAYAGSTPVRTQIRPSRWLYRTAF